MQPKMVIVAGPPGSGKSTAFPVAKFGLNSFNADDRAAALNDGSYRGISPVIRERVGKEFEDFVLTHIEDKQSFAIETTLRTDATFRQAELAKHAGRRRRERGGQMSAQTAPTIETSSLTSAKQD
jgi:predicted ABC-type ATPase